MPNTIFDDSSRAELRSRAGRLTEQSAPLWGRMTSAQMLAHCNDALRMATGELPVAPRGGALLRLALTRWLMIYRLPFPKSVPTAPELLARARGGHDGVAGELAMLGTLIDGVAARRGGAWPAHPAFGVLSEGDWGVLAYKHLDHHLRQFGC